MSDLIIIEKNSEPSTSLTKKSIAAIERTKQHQSLITKTVNQDEVLDDIKIYANKAKAASTNRAYTSDIKQFEEWCKNNGVTSVPVDSVVLCAFITVLANSGLKVSTIERKKAAIAYAHKMQKLPNPNLHEDVSEVMKGIRNSKKCKQNKKKPITDDILIEMLKHCSGDDLRSVRDRAILVTCFLGAFRRSELVALRMEDISFNEKGIDVFIATSKTDQEGKGETIALLDGVNFRLNRTLKNWIDLAKIKSGYIFRPFKKGSKKLNDRHISTSYFAELIKKYANLIGENEVDFSGHSLRRGFMTTAAKNNAKIKKMMGVSRHKKVDTALGYIDDANSYEDHAAENFA